MADDVRPPLLKWAGKILTRSGGLTGDPDCCCKCSALACYSMRFVDPDPGTFTLPTIDDIIRNWPDYADGEWVYWKLIGAGYNYYYDSVGMQEVGPIDWFVNYAACGKIGGTQPDCNAFEAAWVNWFIVEMGYPDFSFSQQECADCKTDAQLDFIAEQMANDADTAGDEGFFRWVVRNKPIGICKCNGTGAI